MIKHAVAGVEAVDLPSGEVPIMPMRSVTPLSTTNCSLSEETRMTIVAQVVGKRSGWGYGKDGVWPGGSPLSSV